MEADLSGPKGNRKVRTPGRIGPFSAHSFGPHLGVIVTASWSCRAVHVTLLIPHLRLAYLIEPHVYYLPNLGTYVCSLR